MLERLRLALLAVIALCLVAITARLFLAVPYVRVNNPPCGDDRPCAVRLEPSPR